MEARGGLMATLRHRATPSQRVLTILALLAVPFGAWGQTADCHIPAALDNIGGSCPPEDHSWHLLQRQRDGLIRSIERGLTKHECDFMAARAMGLPATEDEREIAAMDPAHRALFLKYRPDIKMDKMPVQHLCAGPTGPCQEGVPTDITSAECFQ
jgi:hypothetical protein